MTLEVNASVIVHTYDRRVRNNWSFLYVYIYISKFHCLYNVYIILYFLMFNVHVWQSWFKGHLRGRAESWVGSFLLTMTEPPEIPMKAQCLWPSFMFIAYDVNIWKQYNLFSFRSRCMDCEEMVDLEFTQQYGKKLKCCDCHSSYRFCRDNVKNWSKLSPEEKKEYIKQNKGKGGRGKKRDLVSCTSVLSWATISHSMNITYQTYSYYYTTGTWV